MKTLFYFSQKRLEIGSAALYNKYKIGGIFMNRKITVASVKAKRLKRKVSGMLSRRFDISLALGRRKNAEKPLLSVRLQGELPRELVAFLALIGSLTLFCGLIKLLRRL